MDKKDLPDYHGQLGAAPPWGQVRLTKRTKRILLRGCSKGCPTCHGVGFTGGPDLGTPCHCVNASLPPKRAAV